VLERDEHTILNDRDAIRAGADVMKLIEDVRRRKARPISAHRAAQPGYPNSNFKFQISNPKSEIPNPKSKSRRSVWLFCFG
jgi:hypothetical protein